MQKTMIDFREELSIFNDLNITRDTARQICKNIFESLTNEDNGIRNIMFYPYWDTREFQIYFIVYNTHYNMPLMGNSMFEASVVNKSEQFSSDKLVHLEGISISQS